MLITRNPLETRARVVPWSSDELELLISGLELSKLLSSLLSSLVLGDLEDVESDGLGEGSALACRGRKTEAMSVNLIDDEGMVFLCL